MNKRKGKRNENSNIWAILSYIPIIPLFIIPLYIVESNNLGKHHAKQAFVLWIAWLLTIISFWIINTIIGIIPFIGSVIVFLLHIVELILYITYLILAGIGIYYAFNETIWHMPFFGVYAEKLNI